MAPAETRPVASAGAVFAAARQLTEPALRAAVDRLDRDLRLIAGYHLGWWDSHGRQVTGGVGKAVRPALALLGARTAGGEAGLAVPGAVAVELLHNYSLLHDDIMDRDELRRHRPTAWTVFGVGPAVLAGDGMLTLAAQVLAEWPGGQPAARRLLTASLRLTAGQAADLAFERREQVGLEEYLAMSADKTGALLSCSAAIGAELVGGPPRLVEALAEVGLRLGLGFQAVDDVLGIWGDPAVTGKPTYGDLRQGKQSLPVVAAGLPVRPRRTEEELRAAADEIEAAGGRARAEAEAAAQYDAATRLLDELELPPGLRAEWDVVARALITRKG